MKAIDSRFGPIASATITLTKGRWAEVAWTGRAEVALPTGWTIRPFGLAASLEHAPDRMFGEMTALIRHVTWVRDGVPKPCRWCAGETFIYVRHPADAIEPGDANRPTHKPMRLLGDAGGELEALVCRDCGHVDWFVADPQTLPASQDGVVLVTTRKDPPFR